jgi:hypothetical protein
MKYSTVRLPEKSPIHTRVGPLSPTLASVVKSTIVDALALILAWKPRPAMLLLGRLVWWVFPWLRGA